MNASGTNDFRVDAQNPGRNFDKKKKKSAQFPNWPISPPAENQGPTVLYTQKNDTSTIHPLGLGNLYSEFCAAALIHCCTQRKTPLITTKMDLKSSTRELDCPIKIKTFSL